MSSELKSLTEVLELHYSAKPAGNKWIIFEIATGKTVAEVTKIIYVRDAVINFEISFRNKLMAKLERELSVLLG